MATARQIDEYLDKLGVYSLSPINEDWEEYFTWRGCEICNDNLGNNVVDCHGFNQDRGEVLGPIRVCGNCLCYISNGDTEQLDEEERSG